MMIRPLDREALRRDYTNAHPFPFIKMERFLEPSFAEKVAAAYPSFEEATSEGMIFNAVNERKKIQITDARRFPEEVARLRELLDSTEFLRDLSYITGIPNLLADAELIGGGMHITGPGGRLDVHVDFNYLESRKLYRRLNLLLYLNPVWQGNWGGHIQLWDKDVKVCHQDFEPALNRCVIFETSEISFHGVTPVTSSAPFPRISFAAYYYSREAPPNWKGAAHSTIFKARPDERVREYITMPAEKLQRQIADGVRRFKRGIRNVINMGR
jgi:2OG-Fe(II) oxygenase superfamily